MKKQLQRKTIYEPNRGVKITVINKPAVDQDTGEQYAYDSELVLKIKLKDQPKELKFDDADQIADFIGTIDFDDPQQELPLNEKR